MAITAKKIIGTAVDLGRGAVSRGIELAGNLRNDDTSAPPTTPARPAARGTSGAPSTVGAPKPGEPRGVKSATAPTASKPPAGTAKAPAAKPSASTKAAAKTKARPKAKPQKAPAKAGPTSKS
jgi:hypothetical protein